MTEEADRTRATLLGRLCSSANDESAWAEFVECYGPRIYGWCLRWRLQESDAEDVTQDVLLRLADKMGKYRYDPDKSFRAWLKTLTHHAWADFSRRKARAVAGSGDTRVLQALTSLEARDDLVLRLNEEFDRELMELAMAQVRMRVAPRTWDAFRLTAIEGMPGAEAGRQLDMPAAHVYVARNRVQKMLQQEIAGLDHTEVSAN